MTDPTRPAVGLSVGATTLAAVTPDNSVTRAPVVTLPGGMVISDFVDRVGDPVGIVASDGSVHHAATLLADALRSLAYAATSGRPLPPAAAITYPAHWRPSAVEALRAAIRQIPEWAAEEPAADPRHHRRAHRAGRQPRAADPRRDRAVRFRRQRDVGHPGRRAIGTDRSGRPCGTTTSPVT